MGKRRAKELLAQLKANQQEELENAAAIFTVAQVAVNELREAEQEPQASVSQPALTQSALLDKAQLQERYGSHRQCRSAAKAAGICFSRTPTWEQLVAAFNQAEILQTVIDQYREAQAMPDLPGVSIRLNL